MQERIIMAKTDELLKVLDLSGAEQIQWLDEQGIIRCTESLADLAFRLRDEAVNKTNNFVPGRLDVYQRYLQNQGIERGIMASHIIDDMDVWFVSCAKPIHWIIAALIALKK